MIPKIIHQTWKDDKIPKELEIYVNQVKNLNPDWEYILWTDKDMLEFVKKEFQDFLETYNGYPKNVMRADAFRYLLMYRIGGVYLDLDYEVLKPFDFNDKKVVLPFNRQKANGDYLDGIGNCFFASEPNHQFWLDVINSLKDGDNSNLNKEQPYSTLEEETTGPAFLTRVLMQKKHADIYNPDRIIYHPKTPKNFKEKKNILQNGKSLGIHHCVGSWREKISRPKPYFLNGCKSMLKRIFR